MRRIRRLLPHPWLTTVLTLVWLLLNNTLSPGHVLLGLVLGWLIPLLTLRFWPDTVHFHHPLTLLRFVGRVLGDILVANLNVAQLILGKPERLRPGFFAIPLDLETELAISLLANTVSLTPGTLSVELSPDRRTLFVHGMDVPDPAAMCAEIKLRYEAPLKKVFEP